MQRSRSPMTRPAAAHAVPPVDAAIAVALLAAPRLRAGADVVAGHDAGRHQAVPLPRPGTTGRRTRSGRSTPASSPAGSRTRSSPTCGRPARGTWPRKRSACPTGSPTGCGSPRSCSPPAPESPGPCGAGSASGSPRRSPPGWSTNCRPYLVPYVSRTSSMLLPWAGLGWIVGLTIGAATRTRWRDAALCALVDRHHRFRQRDRPGDGRSGAGAVAAARRGRTHGDAWRRAVVAADPHRRARDRHLAVVDRDAVDPGPPGRRPARLLGIAGGRQLTSTSTEVWRGLGYWLTYVRDAVRPDHDRRADYMTATGGNVLAHPVALGFVLVLVGLVGLVFTRFAARRFAVALTFVGVVLSVGVHPFDDPSPLADLLAGDGESGRGARPALEHAGPAAADDRARPRRGGDRRRASATARPAVRGAPRRRARRSSSRWATSRRCSVTASSTRRSTATSSRRRRGTTPPPRSTRCRPAIACCSCRGRVRCLPLGVHRRSAAARADRLARWSPATCCRSARPRRWTCCTPSTTGSRPGRPETESIAPMARLLGADTDLGHR